MNDICVIRKLVADGDGAGDDRRYAIILPMILRLMKDPSSAQSSVPRILKHLEAAETAMKKQILVARMNQIQLDEYKVLSKQIEESIERSASELEVAKHEQVIAKGHRKNKEEYELMAKMINALPSRLETNQKLENVKRELELQHERQRKLEAQLSDRKNTLHALNIILNDITRSLQDADESYETSSEESPNDNNSTQRNHETMGDG
ncbi:hypothetical protein AB6A40_003817 [Gnathostoma spinigerum]|uniref:THO complex subunit 7 n=1 Tax=Gnathostoma spinigerum TaxID=75299 RepID=A0ABD6EAN3_9BILA